jgi:hypothetical protein
LPEKYGFTDKDGNYRIEYRTKWWLNSLNMKGSQYLFDPSKAAKELKISSKFLSEGYNAKAPTVFFGHYWLTSKENPEWQKPNVCCLDYSVAKKGMLVGFRYYFDQPNSKNEFVSINSKV